MTTFSMAATPTAVDVCRCVLMTYVALGTLIFLAHGRASVTTRLRH